MILLIFIIIFIIILLFYIYKEPFTTDIFIPQKELRFIHITKTGGSSIEDCAYNKNIMLGRYDTEYCIRDEEYFAPWHMIFPYKNLEFKKTYDWFMVVRNPYTRIVSELNYNCPKNIIKNKEKINIYIQYKINNRSQLGNHYTEQYLYMDPDPSIVIHILKFENLKEEFDNLMKLYNIDMVLDIHSNKSESIITFDDLSKETINLINTVYNKDFELFNYDIINVD